MNSVLGENLEGLHQKRGNQRSAPQSAQKCVPQKKAALLNSVQGKTLKTSVSPSTTRNRNIGVLLHTELQPGIGYDRWHFHQLFHLLRLANYRSQGDVLGQDLRHFDDLLGIRHERVEETEDVWQLFHRLRHRSIEDLHHGSKADEVDNVLQGVPLDPLLRSHLDERWRPAPRRALPRTTRRTLHSPLLWTSVSVELCSQPPWPCPSSVPVGRATFHLPPPCRSCGEAAADRAIATLSMSAGVAVFSATRSRVHHTATCRPPGLDRTVTQTKATRNLSGPSCCSCCRCCWLLFL